MEKVSPLLFGPNVVGLNESPPKLIVGRTVACAAALNPEGKLLVMAVNSLLSSPSQPKPAVITRLFEIAFEYVRNRPVPGWGFYCAFPKMFEKRRAKGIC